MYTEQDDVFYYLTVYNENYPQAALQEGSEAGILKGIYHFRNAAPHLPYHEHPQVHLFGSGSIMQEVLAAQDILAEKGVAADVYSVTSYNLLSRDAMECEEWNRANSDKPAMTSYLDNTLKGTSGRFIAVSDYMKALPASIAKWIPGEFICLGTDGYGISASREELRDHFGNSRDHIVRVALATQLTC
jgi:pyruvate dehydrogenase E1 component